MGSGKGTDLEKEEKRQPEYWCIRGVKDAYVKSSGDPRIFRRSDVSVGCGLQGDQDLPPRPTSWEQGLNPTSWQALDIPSRFLGHKELRSAMA